jgi:hypothetical protein
MFRLWVGQPRDDGSIPENDAKFLFLVKRLWPPSFRFSGYQERKVAGRQSRRTPSPSAEVNKGGTVSPLSLCHHGLHIDDFNPLFNTPVSPTHIPIR